MFFGGGIGKKRSGDGGLSAKNDLPNIAKCIASNKSKRENQHINEMVFQDEYYRDRMRNMQATYKVKQDSSPGLGYSSRIQLIWDHDRLLGTFDMDTFKGSLLIDPGPGQEHFKADIEYSKFHEDRAKDKDSSESSGEDNDDVDDGDGDDEIAATREYRFKWRGINTKIPHKTFNSSFTIGKIRFGNGKIWGHFEAMSGVGFPGGRCEFHGKIPHGPCLVDMSIQEFVDKWNGYAETEEDEIPRNPTPSSMTIKSTHSEHDDADSTPSSAGIASQVWTEADQEKFVDMLTGIYDITSREIEEDWSFKSKNLMIRLHVDQQQGNVLGYFDIGIVEGFFCLDADLKGLKHYEPVEFKWHGKGTFSGSSEQGTGTISIKTRGGRNIEGIFSGMPDKNDGHIEFLGTRRMLPLGVSGRGFGYYRAHWEEYTRVKQPSGNNLAVPKEEHTRVKQDNAAVTQPEPRKGRWGVRQELAKRVSWGYRNSDSGKEKEKEKKAV